MPDSLVFWWCCYVTLLVYTYISASLHIHLYMRFLSTAGHVDTLTLTHIWLALPPRGNLSSNRNPSLYATLSFCINMDNRNVSWAENQHIGKISEGSCDTEDWSNDAEKWKYEKCSFDMTWYKNWKRLYNYNFFASIFDQINAALTVTFNTDEPKRKQDG